MYKHRRACITAVVSSFSITSGCEFVMFCADMEVWLHSRIVCMRARTVFKLSFDKPLFSWIDRGWSTSGSDSNESKRVFCSSNKALVIA